LVTSSLEDHLVHDGQVKTPKGTSVTSAKCRTTDTATLARAASAYTCVLTLNNGKSASVKLTAADDGSWTVRT
jgi:ribosomal protein L2